MATAITSTPATRTDSVSVSGYRTVADLHEHLGGVSPSRVRFQPWPGTATVRDVIAVHDVENRLCELVDGVLVEKVMGFRETPPRKWRASSTSTSAPGSAWFAWFWRLIGDDVASIHFQKPSRCSCSLGGAATSGFAPPLIRLSAAPFLTPRNFRKSAASSLDVA